MHEHWQHKRRRSPGMTDEHIDTLYTLARRSGALGGKLVLARAEAVSCSSTRAGPRTLGRRWRQRGHRSAFDFEFGGAYSSEYA